MASRAGQAGILTSLGRKGEITGPQQEAFCAGLGGSDEGQLVPFSFLSIHAGLRQVGKTATTMMLPSTIARMDASR